MLDILSWLLVRNFPLVCWVDVGGMANKGVWCLPQCALHYGS